MSQQYQQLTHDDRCQIYTLLKSGKSKSHIADFVGCHRSTIYRELQRNVGKKGYRFKQAGAFASTRRSKASRRQYVWTDELKFLVEAKLTDFQWSPEQISGWLRRNKNLQVSPERIYQHVWEDKRQGGILYKHLRHGKKKYNKRSGKNAGRGCIKDRVDISERPTIVEDKERFGDLELDTIIGAGHQGAMVSIVDRATKYTWLKILPNRKADIVTAAIIEMLQEIKAHVHTLTFDNGKEFASHMEIAKGLNVETYFARPYCSWERGLNEHTNGLVRQYFPKKTSFAIIEHDDVVRVQHLLNHRPRQILNFKSPFEALSDHITLN